jgi:hypothetical protein
MASSNDELCKKEARQRLCYSWVPSGCRVRVCILIMSQTLSLQFLLPLGLSFPICEMGFRSSFGSYPAIALNDAALNQDAFSYF